ncbi:MAG: hypothetical protein WDM89_10355 [Rhizomicrobium sp.]
MTGNGFLAAVFLDVGDRTLRFVAAHDFRQQHLAGARRHRKKRRVGLLPLFAERRDHHRHHAIVFLQHMQQRIVIDAGFVELRRAAELVIEAEAVEERAQPCVHVVAIALCRAERIGDRRQRLAEIRGHHLLVRHIVRHLAQTVHVVRHREQSRLHIRPHQLKCAPHPCRARDFAEGADMRQAGRAIAGLEQNFLYFFALAARRSRRATTLRASSNGHALGRKSCIAQIAGRHWKSLKAGRFKKGREAMPS